MSVAEEHWAQEGRGLTLAIARLLRVWELALCVGGLGLCNQVLARLVLLLGARSLGLLGEGRLVGEAVAEAEHERAPSQHLQFDRSAHNLSLRAGTKKRDVR